MTKPGVEKHVHLQDALPLSLEAGGVLTPIVEQSAAELGSEASQQLPAKPPQLSGDPCSSSVRWGQGASLRLCCCRRAQRTCIFSCVASRGGYWPCTVCKICM